MDKYQENPIPSKEQIILYPKFKNLNMNQIILINTFEQCLDIQSEILQIPVLGFDSESKPTFKKGETNTGPHLIQLASHHNAYLFKVNPETLSFLATILSSRQQLKVGFGLKNDLHLFRKLNIELNHYIDLAKRFKSFGIENALGVKNAMALLFHVNFPKSKRMSTSNWSKQVLSPEQMDYAAADAYAALLIYEELLRLGKLNPE